MVKRFLNWEDQGLFVVDKEAGQRRKVPTKVGGPPITGTKVEGGGVKGVRSKTLVNKTEVCTGLWGG